MSNTVGGVNPGIQARRDKAKKVRAAAVHSMEQIGQGLDKGLVMVLELDNETEIRVTGVRVIDG